MMSFIFICFYGVIWKTGFCLDLYASKDFVREGNDVTLTCSSQNTIYKSTRWESTQFSSQVSALGGSNCQAASFLANAMLYTCYCHSNGSFSVRLNNVSRFQHGHTWRCFNPFGQDQSNPVTLNVSVPITDVTLQGSAGSEFMENTTLSITCTSSFGLPAPNIHWFQSDEKYDFKIVNSPIAVISKHILSRDKDNLLSSKEILMYTVKRSLNGLSIYCTASNWKNHTVTSKNISFNIIYPPDSAPVVYGYENGKTYRFIESDRVKFSCSVTGGNPLASLSLDCINRESTSITSFFKTAVILNVTWVAMRNTNICSCDAYHKYYGKKATNVTIDVLFPPTKPLFKISSMYVSGTVDIIQNNTLQVACVSRSNPTPNYTWTGPYISDKMEHILTVSNIHINSEGQYECTAKNRMMRSDGTYRDGRNASVVAVKVLYPPGQPTFRFGNSDGQVINLNHIRVIKGDTFSIYCDANGYPTPSFKWDNYRSGRSLYIRDITSDANKTCTATNKMNETVGEYRIGSTSSTVSITVLYPPDIPRISVSIRNGYGITAIERINIIETETISLECFSKSRPTPRYNWFVNKTNRLEGNVLMLMHISREDAGNYTCYVNNLMNRTFGLAAVGNNISSTFLNILYPSDVGSLSETSLEEASKLNITCPVIQGNPAATEVFWTRQIDGRQWNSSQLIIFNVSRADDTVYTCTVFNEMIPTIGNFIKSKKSGEFHLNIFYTAVIKIFFVFGKERKEAIVVNETEEVSFICTTEANPAADITIRSPQSEEIAIISDTNILRHALNNVSCVNAGEYICTGKNNYTRGHASSSRLILIVRCPPRPSSYSTQDEKIASTLHTDVTLQFTARDYLDEPDKTTFMWFKDNTSVENDDNKFVMSSHGLQSNLSIRNITHTDFGRYGVFVWNSVGKYMQSYQLMAKDKPEVPEGFRYIENSITDSSVTLKWTPGFNGGYPQSFLVFYKIITGQQWQNETIIDTGDKEVKHNLSGLFGMTEYQVKIVARNEEGDSAYTDSLQFTTKASTSTAIEWHSSNSLVIVAGTVPTVVIVTIVGIIVVVLIYRKSLRQKHDRQTTRTVLTYEDLDANKREGDMYSQLPTTYEQLNNDRQERSMYMEMEQVQMERENPDYVNIRI